VVDKEHAVFLPPDEMPDSWYNILADLPEPLPPPLDPKTLKPINPEALLRIFAKELVLQEASTTRFIKIPDEVRDAYLRIPRPTPLMRAKRLEKFLKTPAEIYYKCEYISPPGSHKPNTAIPQAYYNMIQGIEKVVTETGAGQWGSALAMAAAMFNLKCTVYMTASSYDKKPGRRIMMETWGAKVYRSPSENTEFGRKILAEDPNHPGSLGIAISEAIEDVLKNENSRYCLGSVLNHVLLHQTIIGQEAKKQFEMIDVYPDVICGCIGGGSNYAGFSYPFMMDKLKGKKPEVEFIACESKAVPSTTKGKYTYDFGDAAEITPLLKMYTLGHEYIGKSVYAEGLRYHAAAPIISLLKHLGFIEAITCTQEEVIKAAKLFVKSEGFIPAPESSYAIKTAIDEALKAKRENREEVIAFNISGHGFLDMKFYEEVSKVRI